MQEWILISERQADIWCLTHRHRPGRLSSIYTCLFFSLHSQTYCMRRGASLVRHGVVEFCLNLKEHHAATRTYACIYFFFGVHIMWMPNPHFPWSAGAYSYQFLMRGNDKCCSRSLLLDGSAYEMCTYVRTLCHCVCA
jgi:hypothetical protein